MQPYVNQMYFPYQQPQIYGQQMQPIVSTIRGKFINSTEDILVNDVPMDGTQAVFVKNDGTEIYTRGWKSDGTIMSHVYRPVEPPKANGMNNVAQEDLKPLYEAINERLDRIDRRLEGIGYEPKQHTTVNANGKRKSNDGPGLETYAE